MRHPFHPAWEYPCSIQQEGRGTLFQPGSSGNTNVSFNKEERSAPVSSNGCSDTPISPLRGAPVLFSRACQGLTGILPVSQYRSGVIKFKHG